MTKKTQKPAKHVRAANQDAPTKRSKPAKPAGKTYIIFGTDEYTKPRGARFVTRSARHPYCFPECPRSSAG